MKRLSQAVALLVALALIYWIGSRPAAAPSDSAKAPPLSGPTLDGKTLALADFAGKVVLVDFWATWCGPCLEEIPEFISLHRRLSPKGFAVLGVSMDEEGAPAVRKFAAKLGMNYPLILNGGERPPAGWVVPGLPVAYLIGRDGTVLKRWLGQKDMAEVGRDVEAALAR